MATPINTAADFSETLKTQFSAIAAGVNYNYSYSGLAFVNAASPIAEGINIKKGEEQFLFEDSSSTYHYCKVPIDIDIITKDNLKNPDLVVADLLKSIGLNKSFSGTAIGTAYINTLSDVPDQQGNLIAHRRIQIEIIFRKTAFGV
jgi:hypothetical protein